MIFLFCPSHCGTNCPVYFWAYFPCFVFFRHIFTVVLLKCGEVRKPRQRNSTIAITEAVEMQLEMWRG